MKKVIISGACGFIGKELTKELLKRGCRVYALAINPDNLNQVNDPQKNLHIINVTFEDYPSLPQIIEERQFDVFIHMAWAGYGKATNDYRIQMDNVVHTCEAVYAAAELGCKKFILADSSHEYLKSFNASGEQECCSIYGSAKHCAQRMARVICHNTGMIFNGVIFTNVFGPGDMSSRSSNTMIRKLLDGQSLDLILGERLYDWTYVDDCVAGVLAAAEKGKPQELYYVGSRMLRPFGDIIRDVRDVLAPDAELNFGKYHDDTFIDYSEIYTYKLYEDTGYLPESNFIESVKKTAEWLKAYDQK